MTWVMRDGAILVATAALVAIGLAALWRVPTEAFVVSGSALSLHAIWLASGGLIMGASWILAVRRYGGWSEFVLSLVLASAAPLAAVPLVIAGDAGTVARLGLSLASVAVLPLAAALSRRIASRSTARRVLVLSVGCVLAAVLVAWFLIGSEFVHGYQGSAYHTTDGWTLRWLLVSVATLVPGLAGASSALRDPEVGLGSHARIIHPILLALAGAIPVVTGVALVTQHWPLLVVPVAVAAATAALLVRVAIGPLAREAGRAASERDLVIQAAETERDRLAAALHDGPLGDVALLVQRLDGAGDIENAALARTIAADLRVVGNDLRLPVLEDLGVGSALEWLAERLTRRAGARVHLSLDEEGRPPATVELAVFRIAQEATLNAVTHGQPPVIVSYRARPDQATLTVTDAGPGISDQDIAEAQRAGHMGLTMMSRRAESIGATLSLLHGPGEGARMMVEWRGGQR